MASYYNHVNFPKEVYTHTRHVTSYRTNNLFYSKRNTFLLGELPVELYNVKVLNERILDLLHKLENAVPANVNVSDIKPTKETITLAIQLTEQLTTWGVEVDDFSCIDEGGIMLGFELQNEQCTLDIYNDGDIIYLTPSGQAKAITKDSFNSEIMASVIVSYAFVNYLDYAIKGQIKNNNSISIYEHIVL